MADNRIQFTIGSQFKGEGFKKAQKAVGDMNRTVKSSQRDISQLAGALGDLDAGFAKSLGAVSGMITAFASLNVASIGIQLTMFAVGKVIESFNAKIEASKKALKDLKKSLDESFAAALKSDLDMLNDKIAIIDSSFSSITKKANEFTAAMEGVRSASAAGGLVDLEVEKLNKLLDAHSEEERKTIEQTYALKTAVEKSAAVAAANTVKLADAADAVSDAEKAVAVADEKLAAMRETIASLERKRDAYRAQGFDEWKKVDEELTKLKSNEAKLESEREALLIDVDIALENQKKATIEATTAQKAADVEVRRVTLANRKLAEAEEERKRKEKLAADAAAQKAAADLKDAQLKEELARETEAAAKLQREANKSAEDLEKAKKEYKEALKTYRENITANAVAESRYENKSSGLGRSGTRSVRASESVQWQVAAVEVAEAIKKGLVKNVSEALKFERDSRRRTRDELNRNSGQDEREARRFERLSQKNDKLLTDSEREFMKLYRDIEAARLKEKNDLVEKATKLAEAEAAAKTTRERIDTIATNSESLPKVVESLADVAKKLDAALKI